MTTLGDTTYGGAGGLLTRLPGDTTNNRVFLIEQAVSSVATAPVWGGLVIGDIPNITVAKGGTGNTSLTLHGLLVGAGTLSVNSPSLGTAGQVLTSNGASADPTFQASSPVGIGATFQLQTLFATATQVGYPLFIAGSSGLTSGLNMYHALGSTAVNNPTNSVFLIFDSVSNSVFPSLPAFTAATATAPATGAQLSGVLVGSFTYRFGNSTGTLTGEQYTASTGAAANAVVFSGSPGATSNIPTNAFTDGTFIYIMVNNSGGWAKFSISGHTLTYVATITYTNMSNNYAPWSDGTSVYQFTDNTNQVSKWALAGGSQTLYSGPTISLPAGGTASVYVIGISSTLLGVIFYQFSSGGTSSTWSASSSVSVQYIPKF